MPVHIGQAEPGFEDPVGLMFACHRRIERFLAVLVDIATRSNGCTLNQSEGAAMETALRYFRDAAPHHTADEERGLFPALQHARAGTAHEVSGLEQDHRRAERLHSTVDRLGLDWMRQGTLDETKAGQLRAALGDLAALYRDHIQVEEEHIFPSARKVLSREILEGIGRGMAERRGVRYTPDTVTAIDNAQMEASAFGKGA